MILVTGATGNVGRQVVEQLVTAGEPVRALSRHPERAGWPDEVEAVRGDLTEDLPPEVFDGVRALYLFPEPRRVEAVVGAAAAAGVEHVVVLSSLAAGLEAVGGLEVLQRRHLVVEQAVEASAMSWTHLRPGMFMTNTLAWAEGIRTDGVVREPYPDATAAPVHEADIAAVAVAALLDPVRHAGAAYALSGPEVLSQLDRVHVLAEVLGRPVRFEEQTRDQARAALLANPWMNESLADTLLDLLAGSRADHVADGQGVLPTVQQVLDRPPLGFARWVEDHRDAFSPGV
jgi:uncharacterized protein YbjT (DUF2867 family)